jgi:hypothetical protein
MKMAMLLTMVFAGAFAVPYIVKNPTEPQIINGDQPLILNGGWLGISGKGGGDFGPNHLTSELQLENPGWPTYATTIRRLDLGPNYDVAIISGKVNQGDGSFVEFDVSDGHGNLNGTAFEADQYGIHLDNPVSNALTMLTWDYAQNRPHFGASAVLSPTKWGLGSTDDIRQRINPALTWDTAGNVEIVKQMVLPGGVTISSGDGSPKGPCKNGSSYRNYTGHAGSTFWDCIDGEWQAKF